MSARFYGFLSPRVNKNRKFNYVPRYYDEDMDDLGKRVKAAEARLEDKYDESNFRERIRSGYERREKAYNVHFSRTIWVSRLRFVLIAAVLTVIVYKLVTNDILSFIFEAFDV